MQFKLFQNRLAIGAISLAAGAFVVPAFAQVSPISCNMGEDVCEEMDLISCVMGGGVASWECSVTNEGDLGACCDVSNPYSGEHRVAYEADCNVFEGMGFTPAKDIPENYQPLEDYIGAYCEGREPSGACCMKDEKSGLYTAGFAYDKAFCDEVAGEFWPESYVDPFYDVSTDEGANEYCMSDNPIMGACCFKDEQTNRYTAGYYYTKDFCDEVAGEFWTQERAGDLYDITTDEGSDEFCLSDNPTIEGACCVNYIDGTVGAYMTDANSCDTAQQDESVEFYTYTNPEEIADADGSGDLNQPDVDEICGLEGVTGVCCLDSNQDGISEDYRNSRESECVGFGETYYNLSAADVDDDGLLSEEDMISVCNVQMGYCCNGQTTDSVRAIDCAESDGYYFAQGESFGEACQFYYYQCDDAGGNYGTIWSEDDPDAPADSLAGYIVSQEGGLRTMEDACYPKEGYCCDGSLGTNPTNPEQCATYNNYYFKEGTDFADACQFFFYDCADVQDQTVWDDDDSNAPGNDAGYIVSQEGGVRTFDEACSSSKGACCMLGPDGYIAGGTYITASECYDLTEGEAEFWENDQLADYGYENFSPLSADNVNDFCLAPAVGACCLVDSEGNDLGSRLDSRSNCTESGEVFHAADEEGADINGDGYLDNEELTNICTPNRGVCCDELYGLDDSVSSELECTGEGYKFYPDSAISEDYKPLNETSVAAYCSAESIGACCIYLPDGTRGGFKLTKEQCISEYAADFEYEFWTNQNLVDYGYGAYSPLTDDNVDTFCKAPERVACCYDNDFNGSIDNYALTTSDECSLADQNFVGVSEADQDEDKYIDDYEAKAACGLDRVVCCTGAQSTTRVVKEEDCEEQYRYNAEYLSTYKAGEYSLDQLEADPGKAFLFCSDGLQVVCCNENEGIAHYSEASDGSCEDGTIAKYETGDNEFAGMTPEEICNIEPVACCQFLNDEYTGTVSTKLNCPDGPLGPDVSQQSFTKQQVEEFDPAYAGREFNDALADEFCKAPFSDAACCFKDANGTYVDGTLAESPEQCTGQGGEYYSLSEFAATLDGADFDYDPGSFSETTALQFCTGATQVACCDYTATEFGGPVTGTVEKPENCPDLGSESPYQPWTKEQMARFDSTFIDKQLNAENADAFCKLQTGDGACCYINPDTGEYDYGTATTQEACDAQGGSYSYWYKEEIATDYPEFDVYAGLGDTRANEFCTATTFCCGDFKDGAVPSFPPKQGQNAANVCGNPDLARIGKDAATACADVGWWCDSYTAADLPAGGSLYAEKDVDGEFKPLFKDGVAREFSAVCEDDVNGAVLWPANKSGFCYEISSGRDNGGEYDVESYLSDGGAYYKSEEACQIDLQNLIKADY